MDHCIDLRGHRRPNGCASPLGLGVRGERVDVVVRPGATVGDLGHALGFDIGPPQSLTVDGRPVDSSVPLVAAGVRNGSVISVVHDSGSAPEQPAVAPAVVRLTIVGGAAAGRAWDVAPGEVVVGAAHGADLRVAGPGVARHHAVARIAPSGDVDWVDLTDTAPVGTSDARISRIGPLLMRASPVPDTPEGGPEELPAPGEWTVPWRRPVLPSAAPPLPAPRPPAPVESPSLAGPVGWATLLAPLAVGVVAMAVLRQPLLLLLGGAAAIATLVPRVVHAVRAWRAGRRARAEADAELARFAGDLELHRRAVISRAWADVFDATAALDVCARPDLRFWARRATSPDAYRVTLGVGSRSCRPVLDPSAPTEDPAVWALLEAAGDLRDVPLPLALTNGNVVGIVGDETMARAVARAIVVQLAALHGPADMLLAAVGDPARHQWEWMSWLPHATDGATRLVGQEADVDLLASAVDSAAGRRHTVVVVDGPALLMSRSDALRQLLAGQLSIAMVVLAPDAASLPACCTAVLEVRADGASTLRAVESTEVPERLTVAGVALADAERAARGLARWHDPEAEEAVELCAVVGLLDVLPPATLQPEELVASWTAHGPDPRPATVIGLGASGPVEVDLVRDGPHALVAGTTGAGKSELLRSLVVGLAVSQSPHDLTFVLVDYKGGSAFDACRELPHVVGVVTDLDDGLANRVLCSLGAELTRREQLLRDAGAGDLAAYRRLPAHEPVPRLVLVVDEFASLAGERPAFLASLVAIAQRGRSLGVHLVLATQRPAGVVSDDIRANTNLRIALRVQDAADSTEVVGDPSASTLPRARPGRATARFGLGELVPLQVACGSVPLPALDAQQVERVDDGRETDDDRPTVLATVVRAIGEAAAAHGSRAPAKPWVDRLPEILPASALPQGAIALVDDPGRQRRFPFSWERTAGHLVVIGAVGSGTTATLRTAALAAAATTAPQRLHLYAVDNGAAGLATLADLPHCGGIIGATERERQLRLLDRLDVELDERCSAAGGARPDVVVVIDDVVGFRRALDDSGEHDATAMLDRVLATGPRVGIVVAVGASSDAGLPRALDGTVASCLTLRRSAADHNTFPAGARRMPPGRGVELRSGLELQIAHHADAEVAVADVARMWPATDVELRPAPVRTLPAVVAPADLPPPTATGTAWSLPLGIDDATLEPALLHLHRGDHLLVSGPARSGRTSTLRLIADALRHARPDAVIAALGFRGTAPPGAITVDTVADLTVHDSRHLVVVLDDAELIEDPGGVLGALVAGRDAIVVAAGRADALRSAYGHWTAALRRQRRGIVLWPTADVDGDVLGVVLPRQRVLRQPAGRGYVVADGDVRRVQLADAQLAEAELVNGLADARYVDV